VLFPAAAGGSPDRSRRVVLVCILLLLASAVNYMDRQTLAVVAKRITTEFQLNNEQYGVVEAIFGWSFALGSLFWGYLVDRFSVRWIYPIGLLGWSAMGFLTGWARGYEDLVACRGLLGFFEAAHWPCGLKTTQALLSEKGRAMGNSVLQSGTSIGAIATPLIMLAILTDEPGSWRIGFQGIALVGALWVVFWLAVVRDSDFVLSHPTVHPSEDPQALPRRLWWHDLLTRRFALVLLMVIAINTMWQLLRAWLPKIMQENYQYEEWATLLFNSVWYVVTDIGCFASGAIALYLATRGWSVKNSRLFSLSVAVAMVATLFLIPWLTGGWVLLAVLLISGAGALGIFPIYYSFAQDVSPRHLGKITSIAATAAWIASSFAQIAFGKLADATGRFDVGLMLVGLLPIIPLVALWLFWPQDTAVPNEKVLT